MAVVTIGLSFGFGFGFGCFGMRVFVRGGEIR